MNAHPILLQIGRALASRKLQAVMIGNAAAALRGAPVTTLDFDFMFRATPANLDKLKRLSEDWGAQILRPFYPVSSLFRMVNDETGLQVDFMSAIHGVKSFSSLLARANPFEVGGVQLQVASIEDIIKSKRLADRPRDRAVLPILEATLKAIHESEKAQKQTSKQKKQRSR
jgi:predicted nucleotidyltransferase